MRRTLTDLAGDRSWLLHAGWQGTGRLPPSAPLGQSVQLVCHQMWVPGLWTEAGSCLAPRWSGCFALQSGSLTRITQIHVAS